MAAVFLTQTDSSRPVLALGGGVNSFQALAISPDGTRVAAAGMDPHLYIWELDPVDLIVRTKATGYSFSLAFSPDSEKLALDVGTGVAILDLPGGGR